MEFTYTPHGVCSRQILLELDGNKVSNVRFIGGCSGNTQGVARLAEGMDVDELISRLQGIRCGSKPTSCPDQLAKALLAAKDNRKYQQRHGRTGHAAAVVIGQICGFSHVLLQA